uniref:Tetratricopeptide repeat protein 5 OB fold domain-containing protein n=1 Tax=Capitella teleta TaxID=283909 RepID=X1Z148_CAPTE
MIIHFQEAVDALYHFRDHYFETHDLENAINKQSDVEVQLQLCTEKLQTLQGKLTHLRAKIPYSIDDKASYFMLLGKALNVLPGTHPEAQDYLTKSVKLNPKLGEAWVVLGECYWSKNDIETAKNCFQGALNHSNDKVALRNLSMVLRQIKGGTQEERVTRIEESVDKAKEAVKLDIKDGASWLILGNAYFSLFFVKGQNPSILKQSLSAYTQAERDSVIKCNPDLYFNRASLYKSLQDYELALNGYQRATLLDPSWNEPAASLKGLLDYLTQMRDLTASKGKLKSKKLRSLLSSLSSADLGPYAGGSYKGVGGANVNLSAASISQLSVGQNPEKVLCGKVICSIQSDHSAAFSFCLVDENQFCISVCVFNYSPNWGVKIGDSVAIPEPLIKNINISFQDQTFDFLCVRVESPIVMVVNGKKQSNETQSPAVLAVCAFSD